jgi:hypothetical protein
MSTRRSNACRMPVRTHQWLRGSDIGQFAGKCLMLVVDSTIALLWMLYIELEGQPWLRLYRCGDENIANGICEADGYWLAIIEETGVVIDFA